MEKITISHPDEYFENVLNLYKDSNDNNDVYYFYNLGNKITMPPNIDENVFEYYNVPSSMPLTTLSYQIYGDMHLWWLILLCNNVQNAVKLISPGSTIKIIKKQYLNAILSSLKNKS
jgi:hypothetical protein